MSVESASAATTSDATSAGAASDGTSAHDFRPGLPLPAQRVPVAPAWTPPDHLSLALSRLRAAAPVDAVEFTAACPACGADCTWHEQREDTRLCVRVACACGAATVAQDAA